MNGAYQVPVWENLVPLIPVVLVVLYGLGLAAHRWNRHPRVSLVATVALCILLAAALGSRLLLISMAYLGLPGESVSMLVLVVGLMSSLGCAASVSLLLWATFGWRGAPAKPLRRDDDPLS